VPLTTSIGIAVFPQHGKDAEEILKHVDAALYQAKLNGRNRVGLFADEQSETHSDDPA
jgi:diguanylate cyclase (GGDEF)-like protein